MRFADMADIKETVGRYRWGMGKSRPTAAYQVLPLDSTNNLSLYIQFSDYKLH
jgi:hypothetical protein